MRSALAIARGVLGDPADEVLFIDDLARVLRTTVRTINRRRRMGAFPIPELRRIDKRSRWSRAAVDAYLHSTAHGGRR